MTPGPDDITTQDDREPLLSRWSRLKEEARQTPPHPAPEKAADPKAPAPELPPLDKLTPESDYRAFFHPKVNEDVRRAALKKLFSDPHFNVMDGLDVYIDDYSKTEPIPAAMLVQLKQAQYILKWAKEDAEERAKKELQQEATSAQALEPPASQSTPGTGIQANTPEAAPALPDGASEQTKS